MAAEIGNLSKFGHNEKENSTGKQGSQASNRVLHATLCRGFQPCFPVECSAFQIMSETTKIQWCDASFSPWFGCDKVSDGCKNCYIVFTTPFRVRGLKHGAPRQRPSSSYWRQPIKWNKTFVCSKCGWLQADIECSCSRPDPHTGWCESEMRRKRIFPSLCDWLDDEVPIEWLADFLKLIHATPNLDWLLLTKRPQNFRSRIVAASDWHFDHGDRNVCGWLIDWVKHNKAPANIWIGTSVENQACADVRIPQLLEIPAKIRFISCEPLLGQIDLSDHLLLRREKIHWAILGGESGANSRPCNIAWIRSMGTQCRIAHVPVFVKQMGKCVVDDTPSTSAWPDGTDIRCAGPVLIDKKGGDILEWPADLRVREFPV